jgi:hypothetical protein
MKSVSRATLVAALAVALPLLIAGGAAADSSTTFGTLQPGDKICTNSITGTNTPRIKGIATGSVRWTMWSNNVDDLTTAFKLFKVNAVSVDTTVLSNGSFFWGCAFNEFSAPGPVTVNNLTISG